MNPQSAAQPAHSLDLLDALWAWERDYRHTYRHLNAEELRRLWYVLTQLTAQCATDYQKATSNPPDAPDAFPVPWRG
jgi:hypothetical protein